MAYSPATEALAGKTKKPKKVVKEVHTRKAANGGYIHTHHHTRPDAHPPEDHVSPDQAAMVAHMMQTMGSGGGAPAPPPDQDAQAPIAAPAPVGPPGM